MLNVNLIITVIVLALLEGCVSKPPVVVLCEQPDKELVKPLEFCPASVTLGELEDCLVEFVRKTLPEDNARKTELLRQLETLRQPR